MTVPLLDGVDWEVVGIFAALVLMEGLRRVPAGALVTHGTWWSGWRPAGETEPRGGWRLVSCWSPVALSLVLPPLEGPATPEPDQLAARLGVARRAAPWLAGGGALTLAGLILGLPVATARLGAIGFFSGAALVLGLAVATAAGGALALRRVGGTGTQRRRQVLGWCSPFASGRVVEGVYEAALAGASPAQALRLLAGERVFAEWARRRAYDVVRAGATDRDLSVAADPATLNAIVSTVPDLDPDARSYCPRCGGTWSLENGPCPDCTVPLVSSPADRS